MTSFASRFYRDTFFLNFLNLVWFAVVCLVGYTYMPSCDLHRSLLFDKFILSEDGECTHKRRRVFSTGLKEVIVFALSSCLFRSDLFFII